MSKTVAKAPEILPRLPIDNLVHQINRDWDEGLRHQQKTREMRVVACRCARRKNPNVR
jgi:hypothetical protein